MRSPPRGIVDPRDKPAGDGWGCRTRACLLVEKSAAPARWTPRSSPATSLRSLPHLSRQTIRPPPWPH